MKNRFYTCKEIFIGSGYCKLLLNQGYMLFVRNVNFNGPAFQLLSDFST